MLAIVCIIPILVALALLATSPRSGGLIDASALSLTLRGSKYLKVRGHLIPGVHVAASWSEWVEQWAGQRPPVTVQTFDVIPVRTISVPSRGGK